MAVYEKSSLFEASRKELFTWHMRPGAFERLSPPWVNIRVEQAGQVREGERVSFAILRGPFRVRWEAVHRDIIEGRQFSDIQLKGPFSYWRHIHHFEARDSGGVLTDRIEYRLPVDLLSAPLIEGRVRRELERLLWFRHERLRRDLARHREQPGKRALRIAVTGASGMIGRSLVAFLSSGGHEVFRLVRRPPAEGKREIHWKPHEGVLDPGPLEGLDAVIHLSGENIASGRWSEERKRAIMQSRKTTTRLVSQTLARLRRTPETLICASAVGYYDQVAPETKTEESGKGTGFLADVVEAWERESEPARKAGIRVVNLRMGPILSPTGGALAKMLIAYRLGLGAVVGDGRQFFSWLGLDDLMGVFLLALRQPALSGPVNATSPNPVTNREFTKTLGRVLRRPTILRVPAPVVRVLFGQMGETTLLRGTPVLPAKLLNRGFEFQEPDLEGALRWELGVPKVS